MTHAVSKKAAHWETYNHYLRPRPFTKEAAQPIQPVIVSGGFKEDGVDPQAGGCQLLQSVYVHTRE